jgi:hypothetical protein
LKQGDQKLEIAALTLLSVALRVVAERARRAYASLRVWAENNPEEAEAAMLRWRPLSERDANDRSNRLGGRIPTGGSGRGD